MCIEALHEKVTIRAYQFSDLTTIVMLWYQTRYQTRYQTWHQTCPHLQHPYPCSAWEEKFRDYLAVHGVIKAYHYVYCRKM